MADEETERIPPKPSIPKPPIGFDEAIAIAKGFIESLSKLKLLEGSVERIFLVGFERVGSAWRVQMGYTISERVVSNSATAMILGLSSQRPDYIKILTVEPSGDVSSMTPGTNAGSK